MSGTFALGLGSDENLIYREVLHPVSLSKEKGLINEAIIQLSVLPGEILATDGVSTAVGNGVVVSDGTSVKDEGAVIAPEQNVALLSDDWGALKTPFRRSGVSFAATFRPKNTKIHPVFPVFS